MRLEEVDAFAGHLVVHQRSDGLTQLRILELGDDGVTDDYLVEFDEPVYTVGSGGNPSFDQPVVRLGYTTMAIPSSVYDYDVRTRELTLLRRTPVLGGYDPADYEEHRLWATADDGERVPISIVAKRGAREGVGRWHPSGPGPALRVRRLRDVDGPVLLGRPALPPRPRRRVRHRPRARRRRDGPPLVRRRQAARTSRTRFGDFVACARHLAETGWTTPELTIAEGASAGGLLMGAIANQAPEAFGGIVAGVPFVDNLTTMLDATLPLTVTEYEEWGNPEGDAEVYDYIAGYAPYDNVAAVDYPPILAETSLHDTRVLYVEPAKWIARLRATATGRRDFLLKTEMSAGHGGVSGRYKSWHDRAFSLAWILDRMGLASAPALRSP